MLLTDEEAKAIASPIARLFSTSELNKKYGRRILDSNDLVAAVVVLGLYLKRTAPAFQAKMTSNKGVASNVSHNGSDSRTRSEAGQQSAPILPIFDKGFRDLTNP